MKVIFLGSEVPSSEVHFVGDPKCDGFKNGKAINQFKKIQVHVCMHI